MSRTDQVIFLDFKELKRILGFNKLIVDAYVDADNNRLVIEVEPTIRPGDGGSVLYGTESIDVTELHKRRQIEHRQANGKRTLTTFSKKWGEVIPENLKARENEWFFSEDARELLTNKMNT